MSDRAKNVRTAKTIGLTAGITLAVVAVIIAATAVLKPTLFTDTSGRRPSSARHTAADTTLPTRHAQVKVPELSPWPKHKWSAPNPFDGKFDDSDIHYGGIVTVGPNRGLAEWNVESEDEMQERAAAFVMLDTSTGKQLWKLDAPAPNLWVMGVTAQYAVLGLASELAYFNHGTTMWVVDLSTGAIVAHDSHLSYVDAPTALNGDLLVQDSRGFERVTPGDLVPKWRIDADVRNEAPMIGPNTIIVGDAAYALSDGTKRPWKPIVGASYLNVNGSLIASPHNDGDRSSDPTSSGPVLTRVDETTGATLWSLPADSASTPMPTVLVPAESTQSSLWYSPWSDLEHVTLADDGARSYDQIYSSADIGLQDQEPPLLVVDKQSGKISAIKISNGSMLWQLHGQLNDNTSVDASLSDYGKLALLPLDAKTDAMTEVDLRTGEQLRQISLSQPGWRLESALAMTGTTIYLTGTDTTVSQVFLVALDAQTGTVRWKWPLCQDANFVGGHNVVIYTCTENGSGLDGIG